MSINTAHASNGVLLHATEYLMLYIDCVRLEIKGEQLVPLYGIKFGHIYLTSHRMIFINSKDDNMLQSVSFPYVALSDINLKAPSLLDINFIEGKLSPQPGGHIHNELTFKMRLNEGGEDVLVNFLQYCIKSAKENISDSQLDVGLPAYEPILSWFEPPPVSYEPPDLIKEILPTHPVFSNPQPNTIFATGMPPPYVGIIGPIYKEPKPKECRIWPKCCCAPPKSVPKHRDFSTQVKLPHNCRLAGGIDVLNEPPYGCNKADPMAEFPNILYAGNAEHFLDAYKPLGLSPSPSVYIFKPPGADSDFFRSCTVANPIAPKLSIDKCQADDAYEIELTDVLEKKSGLPKA